MKSETAMSAALAAKGMTARNVKFQLALAEFQNNGGEYGVALAMLNAAYGKGSEGSTLRAASLATSADASRTDASKGFGRIAGKARTHAPDDATERSAGHTSSAIAGDASDDLPVASPRNKPGHARRGAAAIAGVQSTMAKSLFDTIRLPGDDRAIGDVTWKELQGLARKHAEAYRLLALLDGYAQPSDPDIMVRHAVKEDTLREFFEIARLSNVH